jgi:AcrR family transcriptional regulator
MSIDIKEFTKAENGMDRRKKKTQIAIENALLELLQTKPLEEISISELSDYADINRKTFYNNYSSIEEVLQGINQKLSLHIFNALPEKITINNEIEIYNLLLNFTTALEPQKEILKQITQTSDNISFIQYFKDQILPYVERNLLSYHVDPALTPYINNYLINGISSIFFEWFQDDRLHAKDIALLCYNLTTSAIKLDNYKDIKPSAATENATE